MPELLRFEGRVNELADGLTVRRVLPAAPKRMTAARGIVHSERVTDQERGKFRRLHGLQLWVALPPELEEAEPSFQHVAAQDIPEHKDPGGALVRVLVELCVHRPPAALLPPPNAGSPVDLTPYRVRRGAFPLPSGWTNLEGECNETGEAGRSKNLAGSHRPPK